MELPELPPEYYWRKGSDYYPNDYDVIRRSPDSNSMRERIVCWVEANGCIKPGTQKAPTQEEGMQILATRLWLGMGARDD